MRAVPSYAQDVRTANKSKQQASTPTPTHVKGSVSKKPAVAASTQKPIVVDAGGEAAAQGQAQVRQNGEAAAQGQVVREQQVANTIEVEGAQAQVRQDGEEAHVQAQEHVDGSQRDGGGIEPNLSQRKQEEEGPLPLQGGIGEESAHIHEPIADEQQVVNPPKEAHPVVHGTIVERHQQLLNDEKEQIRKDLGNGGKKIFAREQANLRYESHLESLTEEELKILLKA